MKIIYEDLQEVIIDHQKFLQGEPGGKKADLEGYDL